MPGNRKQFHSKPAEPAEGSAACPKRPPPYMRKPKLGIPWGLIVTVIVASLLGYCYIYFNGKQESRISYFAFPGSQSATLKREGIEKSIEHNVSLKEGDELSTHGNPLTVLLIPGGSIRLSAKTHVIVESDRKANGCLIERLALDYGRCWVQAKGENNLEIAIRGRIAKIRSALVDFCLAEDGAWIISVWSGEICFESNTDVDTKDIVIERGKGLLLKTNGTLAECRIKPDKWDSLNNDLSLNRLLTEDLSSEMSDWEEACGNPQMASQQKTAQIPQKAIEQNAQQGTGKTPGAKTPASLKNTPPPLPGGGSSSKKTSNAGKSGSASDKYPRSSPTVAWNKGNWKQNFAQDAPHEDSYSDKGFVEAPNNPYYKFPARLTERGLDKIPEDTEMGRSDMVESVTIANENDLKYRFQNVTNRLRQEYNMFLTRSYRLVIVGKEDSTEFGCEYAALAQFTPEGHTLYFRENIRDEFLDCAIAHEFSHSWLDEYHHYRYSKEAMDIIQEGFAQWMEMKYALINKDYPQALRARGLSETDVFLVPGLEKYYMGIQRVLKIEEEYGERGVFKYVTTGVNPLE